MSAEVKEEGRKGRKKRKEGRPGSTSGTRARVAWSRAARETSEARQPVGPYWSERSHTGARRASALNRQDAKKKLGSPEGQTPPVKLEPTLFGLEVEIQRLVPQAKGGGLVMPAGREARAQVVGDHLEQAQARIR